MVDVKDVAGVFALIVATFAVALIWVFTTYIVGLWGGHSMQILYVAATLVLMAYLTLVFHKWFGAMDG